MDKKKIEIIAVAILAAIFVYFWAGTLTKVTRRTAVTTPAIVSGPGMLSTELFGTKQPAPVEKTEGSGWGRDPFALRETSPQEADTIASLKLMGITASDKTKAMAVMNDEIVRVGSKIGKFRVLKINPKSVVVTDGTENYTLKME